MRSTFDVLLKRCVYLVQVAVFSAVLGALRKTDSTPASVLYPVHHPPSDICVSAPTGSGKTLSYIVPIVEVSGRAQTSISSTFSKYISTQAHPLIGPLYSMSTLFLQSSSASDSLFSHCGKTPRFNRASDARLGTTSEEYIRVIF